MKNNEKKQELKNMVADLCAADAVAILEKHGCKILVEKAHKVCYYGGERLGQIDSWYKKATRDNANGETKQPKKATRKGRNVTTTARPFNALVLSFCRREYIDLVTADNADRARDLCSRRPRPQKCITTAPALNETAAKQTAVFLCIMLNSKQKVNKKAKFC